MSPKCIYGKKQIKIGILSLVDIFKLFAFFIDLDQDLETRKYYRYLPCHNLILRIKGFIILLFRLSILYYLLMNRRLLILGAFDGDKLIGICHIDIDLEKKIGIYGIIVMREYRGLGLGKLLSLKAINLTTLYGVNRIILSVDSDNIKAMKLYKKLGFVQLKKIKNGDYRYISRKYTDIIVMGLRTTQ